MLSRPLWVYAEILNYVSMFSTLSFGDGMPPAAPTEGLGFLGSFWARFVLHEVHKSLSMDFLVT